MRLWKNTRYFQGELRRLGIQHWRREYARNRDADYAGDCGRGTRGDGVFAGALR